ncbi:lipase [Marinobacter psychrophilus]|jgi:acetyl esterase/lipase|uniref:Lipase n=1 Tax=Marinobacter psychrophilus TaxID=330734 RepID=A0A0H4HZM7_9GAMM|nr:alpha/beta hydrolase [Marinobacter psychrophilus]AKO51063.1 lipase [Marinobacter psychrophilus]
MSHAAGYPGKILGASIFLLTALASLPGCSHYYGAKNLTGPEPETTEYDVVEGLVYTPGNWPQALTGDLYLPQQSGPSPVVLMVHGGGWNSRSPADMVWIAEEFASHGFAVFNIAYRLAPEYTFPAQLHDLQVARQWLATNGSRYGLDAQRVSGFGFSSGAHLVALLAVVASSDSDLNQPYGGVNTRLQAVVAGGIPADLARFDSGKLLFQFLGANKQQIPETYRIASPITHITPQTPPFFLFHGGMDLLVPFSQAENFHRALLKKGVDSGLLKLNLRGHITSFLTGGNAVEQGLNFLARQQKPGASQ